MAISADDLHEIYDVNGDKRKCNQLRLPIQLMVEQEKERNGMCKYTTKQRNQPYLPKPLPCVFLYFYRGKEFHLFASLRWQVTAFRGVRLAQSRSFWWKHRRMVSEASH